jgi:RimJ/RimL family protein N-acetyltransferase
MIAPITLEPTPHAVDREFLPTSASHDDHVAQLLAVAYDDTIDFDPDANYARELHTWRTHDGADDLASRIAFSDGQLVGACLIGSELGHPFLYEIAVHPDHRQRGLAADMLTSSLNHLAAAGHEVCAAYVTCGNVASERLLETAGFVPVTPPVDQRHGVLLYRAGSAVSQLDLLATVAAGVAVDDERAVARLIGEHTTTPATVDVNGTTVSIQWIAIDDPRLPELVSSIVPIHGVASLLAARPNDSR